jgi:hypothetical protein
MAMGHVWAIKDPHGDLLQHPSTLRAIDHSHTLPQCILVILVRSEHRSELF